MKTLVFLLTVLAFRLVHAEPESLLQLERLRVGAAENPSFERDVYGVFKGLPWARYQMQVSSSLGPWAGIGQAAESAPGQYAFLHSGDMTERFFRAEVLPPGPEKTYDAWFTASAAEVSSAIHRFTRSYAFETLLGVANVTLGKGQMTDELSDALAGQIVVVEDPPGQWRIAWGGQEVMTGNPVAWDHAVADFQAAEQQAAINLGDAEEASASLQNFPPLLEQAMTLLDGEGAAALADRAAIQCLPLPSDPLHIEWQAPLAFFDLQALEIRVASLDVEKTALQDAIDRGHAEAQRKRNVADMPVNVFGINGTWYVRWSAIERAFASQAEAEAFRDGFIAARRREADGLDAGADQQEAQLQQICNQRDALAAGLPAAQTEADDKENELNGVPATNPDDDSAPRAHYKTWIDFDPLYLDWMWLEMFREWQRHKDEVRTKLQQMGASQTDIDAVEARWANEQKCRRKWMLVYCDDPIDLKLLFVNQFTGFQIDAESAVWEVEYQNVSTFQPEREQLGTGSELHLTAAQVKEIWAKAKEKENFSGIAPVLDFHVTFDKVYENGGRETCEQLVQIIIENRPRAEAEAEREAIRTATPGGYR